MVRSDAKAWRFALYAVIAMLVALAANAFIDLGALLHDLVERH